MSSTIAIRHLETMFKTLNRGIVFLDRSGAIISANVAMLSLLGRPFLDVLEPPQDDPEICVLGDDERPLSVAQYPSMAAIRTGAKVQNSVMGIFNPVLKERRWFSVDACPIYDHGQTEPSASYAIFTDITDRRRADRELRQSKLHLAMAQSIASIGSAAVDFKTGKWDWSDETFRIYGVDRETFTPSAEGLGNLVHPDDWKNLYANVPRAREGRAPETIAEYRITRPDGAERMLRRIATAVTDDEGTITGIVATVQDVTELRMTQHENKALQNQLYHAQRLDSVGTIASGIAHDLNNTLASLVATSGLLLQSMDESDPNRLRAELIKEAGLNASELVAQVLAFARREVLAHEPIEVAPFLAQSVKLVRASVANRIEIHEDLADTPPVTGNPSQLRQVLFNLFFNAAQAIGDRPGRIDLSTARVEGEDFGGETGKPYVRISVADTGSGMSDETKAHIFEPFFTTKGAGRGTGLGLSVVQGIVSSHGGRIGVASKENEGTRFDVFLPVAAT
ncbi:MAG TPA: ATP-binding protein [Rhizomicrobium sp.]|nr:ATP-binding protein [Rhizomicrobium sp.]